MLICFIIFSEESSSHEHTSQSIHFFMSKFLFLEEIFDARQMLGHPFNTKMLKMSIIYMMDDLYSCHYFNVVDHSNDVHVFSLRH